MLLKNVAFIVLDSISYNTFCKEQLKNSKFTYIFKHLHNLPFQRIVYYNDGPNTASAIKEFKLDKIANYYNSLGYFTVYAVDWRYGCWVDRSMIDYRMKQVFRHYINIWKNDGHSSFQVLIETALSQKIDPCFLYIHGFDTHNPYMSREKMFYENSDKMFPDLYYKKFNELNSQEKKQVKILKNQYYENCKRSDKLIQEFFNDKNWIKIICGDHSELMYEINNYGHDLNRAEDIENEIIHETFLSSNAPLINKKHKIKRVEIYDEVINAAKFAGVNLLSNTLSKNKL